MLEATSKNKKIPYDTGKKEDRMEEEM